MRLVPRAHWRDRPDQDKFGSAPTSESKSGQGFREVPVVHTKAAALLVGDCLLCLKAIVVEGDPGTGCWVSDLGLAPLSDLWVNSVGGAGFFALRLLV